MRLCGEVVVEVENVTDLPKGPSEIREKEAELRQCMVGYQAGDVDAVEELVRRLSPRLVSYFTGPVGHAVDVEDLLQECWLRIHRSRHTYRATDPLLPWVFAIARHTMLDDRRRRSRRAAREVLLREPPEPPSQMAAAKSRVLDMDQLFEQLPPTQRDVLLLLNVAGMTMAEAARVTSSSVAATKQRAHRAYARLRAFLAKGE
jgi:RNA polymerase sigma-70 factor (ECF subfamily)